MGKSGRKHFKRDILERVNKIKITVNEVVVLARKIVMNLFMKAKCFSMEISLDEIIRMPYDYGYIFEKKLDQIEEEMLLNKKFTRQ